VRPASGSQVHGEAKFTQVGNRVRVTAEIAGLTPGVHGFHIHEKGDCSAADGMSTWRPLQSAREKARRAGHTGPPRG
jgi:Cu-Zn family superoxide dismutase